MSFVQSIQSGYQFRGSHITLGAAMHDGDVYPEAPVSVPLSMMNRHGLIAGATGTGKTKSIQKIIESLSLAGVPTVIMDIKGDISGLAMAGTPSDRITTRLTEIGQTESWKPTGYPSEFYTLTGTLGVRLRSTVSELGPILMSRMLGLNETQESIMSLIYRYADDQGLLLIDLSDIKKVLQYLMTDGKDEISAEYGMISPASVGTIMRKIIELESQGAESFFGEPSFDVTDFMRCDDDGHGYVNILRLMDMQTRPKLFSTFMMSLLSELYQICPEEGDIEKPKLVICVDEAHLLFDEASDALLSQMETIIRLIRSKGVGIFFCTQNPIDIPESILGQLGLKIQHALRAFTARDNEAIQRASKNFPTTEYYDISKELLILGVGEALVTTLDERGIPTPLVRTMMAPPTSRMDTLTDDELTSLVSISPLVSKYNMTIDPESAREILERRVSERMAQITAQNTPSIMDGVGGKIIKNVSGTLAAELGRSLGKSLGGRTGGTVGAQIARGLLGAIFGGK